MTEHGLGIDGLAVIHHELRREPPKDRPKAKRSIPTAAPEKDGNSAGNAQRGNLFENQSNE